MYRHGTEPWKPGVRVILQTVTRDIERSWENEHVRKNRRDAKAAGAPARAHGRTQKLCFLPQHVRGCIRESDVLERAIKGSLAGQRGHLPIDTRRMYADVELLKAAQAAARSYGR